MDEPGLDDGLIDAPATGRFRAVPLSIVVETSPPQFCWQAEPNTEVWYELDIEWRGEPEAHDPAS